MHLHTHPFTTLQTCTLPFLSIPPHSLTTQILLPALLLPPTSNATATTSHMIQSLQQNQERTSQFSPGKSSHTDTHTLSSSFLLHSMTTFHTASTLSPPHSPHPYCSLLLTAATALTKSSPKTIMLATATRERKLHFLLLHPHLTPSKMQTLR